MKVKLKFQVSDSLVLCVWFEIENEMWADDSPVRSLYDTMCMWLSRENDEFFSFSFLFILRAWFVQEFTASFEPWKEIRALNSKLWLRGIFGILRLVLEFLFECVIFYAGFYRNSISY